MAARVLLVVASAALHALAMPPLGWSAAAWVALVPFFVGLQGLDVCRAALLGLLWGTIEVWGVGYWVPIALATYYEQPWWFGAAFALGASVVFAGSYAAGFAACNAWMTSRVGSPLRPLLLAAVWVAWEFARARLLTGEPWILLGYALMPERAMIQVGDLGGVYALSFQVVLVNVTLAELLREVPRGWRAAFKRTAPTVAIVGAAALYGWYRLATVWPSAPATPVTIVQGNNDVGHQWRDDFHGEGLQSYLTMSRAGARANGSELLVWPESSITFFVAHEPRFRLAIGRMLGETGADLVLGGPHHDEAPEGSIRYYNSAFYLGRDGVIASRYDKTHLLPFAEYFPLRTIEFLRRRFERVRFFTHGDPGGGLATRFGDVATVICFEGIFPEIVRAQTARGARLLINLSNDAWLGRGAGPQQHLAMVALRAVENRLWVIRATTTGISAFIDPTGRVVERTSEGVAEFLNGTVVPMSVPTVYKRWGDVFAFACVVVTIAAVIALQWRRRDVAGEECAQEPECVASI